MNIVLKFILLGSNVTHRAYTHRVQISSKTAILATPLSRLKSRIWAT